MCGVISSPRLELLTCTCNRNDKIGFFFSSSFVFFKSADKSGSSLSRCVCVSSLWRIIGQAWREPTNHSESYFFPLFFNTVALHVSFRSLLLWRAWALHTHKHSQVSVGVAKSARLTAYSSNKHSLNGLGFAVVCYYGLCGLMTEKSNPILTLFLFLFFW